MTDWLALALVSEPAPDGPGSRAEIQRPPGQISQISQNTGPAPIFGTNGIFGQGVSVFSEASGPASGPYRSGQIGEWQRSLFVLSPDRDPCPGFRRWHRVLKAAGRFLDRHGERAAELGWTTLDLFAVHPIVGTIRVDYSGALMLSGGSDVVAITVDEARLANGLVYRRRPWPAGIKPVPVWTFGQEAA